MTTPAAIHTSVNRSLAAQMLSWIALKPRTYAETMDAWRTSCPRLSIWEDAVAEGLVAVSPVQGGGMTRASVTVTPRGLDLIKPS